MVDLDLLLQLNDLRGQGAEHVVAGAVALVDGGRLGLSEFLESRQDLYGIHSSS